MDLSNLKALLQVLHITIISVVDVDMVQETEKQLVKATKVRRHVLVHQE